MHETLTEGTLDDARDAGRLRAGIDDDVARKSKEHTALRTNLIDRHNLNTRQVRVLQYFHTNPEEFISTHSHQQINGVSGPTAANDIKRLVELGFLEKRRSGRTVRYFATGRLTTLFKA
ncbi:MAG TPA: hypothetical protein VJK73_01850 [Candidatus Paceibacterota bacterium]